MTINILEATKNAMLEELRAAFTLGGTIEFRTGAAPASVSDPDSGTMLLTYTLPAPAFAAASGGAITTLGAPYAAIATATGTPGHARFKDSTSQAIIDMPVGPAVPIADTDDATDTWTTLTAHGYVETQAVIVYQGSTTSTVAYVSVVDATNLQLLDGPGGAVLPAPPSGTYTAGFLRDARFNISVSSAAGTVTTGDTIVVPEFGVSL
jgi:hypothetical protein